MQEQKELQMIICKQGILNSYICQLVGMNNEKKTSFTLFEIEAILKGKKVDFPSTLENMEIMNLYDEIIIMEDGKTITTFIKATNSL